ncbi:FimV/HubP family polar landmark protein [Candidiatus Paracoxiella cheracis]|uniref:FimV/HubP family polar landmark protein n=1 Tax=Candidiatus Paracoxiella cheracis TaxID=3405120 RepID=UPI003BF48CEA
MNKCIRYLVVGLMLLPLSALAANDVTRQATPVQNYQSADDTNTTNNNPNQKWIDSTQSSSNSAAAKKVASNPSADTTKSGSTIPEKAEKSIAQMDSVPDHQGVQMLQAELTQINQNNLSFQQKMDERVLELSNKNQQLEQRLQELTQAMTLLNQEIISLKKTTDSLKYLKNAQPIRHTAASTFVEWAQIINNHLGSTGLKAIISGVVILIILLLWAIWPRNNKKKKQKTANRNSKSGDHLDGTEAEYDYMGSEEGVPAKLDLARTYIAMEDYDTARKVLAEVNKHGDQSHKEQAQAMLDEIPAES